MGEEPCRQKICKMLTLTQIAKSARMMQQTTNSSPVYIPPRNYSNRIANIQLEYQLDVQTGDLRLVLKPNKI